MDHSGHRERMKAQFLRTGLECFSEEKILEILLYYVIPRRDTVPIAKELLSQFGSLVNVLSTPMDALVEVPGMGEGTALYLRYIMAVYRYCFMQQNKVTAMLNTVEKCAEYVSRYFVGRREESVVVLCLDGRCHCAGCKVLGEGGVNSANVPIRRIVEYSLTVKAYSVILAHNHPSGLAIPSAADVESTMQVAEALARVGIPLVDHLIITNEDYTSMAHSGYLCGLESWIRRREAAEREGNPTHGAQPETMPNGSSNGNGKLQKNQKTP